MICIWGDVFFLACSWIFFVSSMSFLFDSFRVGFVLLRWTLSNMSIGRKYIHEMIHTYRLRIHINMCVSTNLLELLIFIFQCYFWQKFEAYTTLRHKSQLCDLFERFFLFNMIFYAPEASIIQNICTKYTELFSSFFAQPRDPFFL